MATAPKSADAGASILETAAPIISPAEAKALHVPTEAAVVDQAQSAQVASEPTEEEPYYWENGGDQAAPITKVVTHNLHWLGLQLFSGVEFVGEVFAEFLGMTNSRYEWAIEAAREQEAEAEAEERREEQRRRWEMIQRLNEAEAKQKAEALPGAAQTANSVETTNTTEINNATSEKSPSGPQSTVGVDVSGTGIPSVV